MFHDGSVYQRSRPHFSATHSFLMRCPHLPDPVDAMDWRDMHAHRHDQGGAFYLTALRYAQHLWATATPARALLAVDRALYAELDGSEPELTRHPLPYAAVAWMVAHAPGRDAFAGNARVHYQHLADRVRGARAEQKRWRAWAAWALTRRVRPDLPADPKHAVREPSLYEIATGLRRHGLPDEATHWLRVLAAPPAAAAVPL